MIGYMALMTSAREYTQYTDLDYKNSYLRICKNCELGLRNEEKEMCRLGTSGKISDEVIKRINEEEDYASETKVHTDQQIEIKGKE